MKNRVGHEAAVSASYSELIPSYPFFRGCTVSDWRDGLVTGNGKSGAVCACAPYDDTIIYQDIRLIMPTGDPRHTPPEVTAELEEARQAVIRFDASWDVHGRERTFLYRYHPVYQLRLRRAPKRLLAYERETDYETGEVETRFCDEDGKWLQKTFTSRSDDVTVTALYASDAGAKLSLTVSIDDLSTMRKFGEGGERGMRYRRLMPESGAWIGLCAHYPDFPGSELREGGYAGVTRVIVEGGRTETRWEKDGTEEVCLDGGRPVLSIRDADAVYLLTKADRTHRMGTLASFGERYEFPLVEALTEQLEAVVRRFTDENGRFSYERALAPHAELHGALFRAASFSLGGGEESSLSNEELLRLQEERGTLPDALLERIYRQARYAMICSAGFSAPRLCGLWTGEWNPGWSGAYTMDANVNLQVSGMNTANLPDAAVGYIHFVLRQLPDWEDNARMTYGMHDAIQVPVNTDGDCAVMVEYDHIFPFEYWNAGASWMLLPIFEFWQCWGSRPIPLPADLAAVWGKPALDLETEILLPLLRKQANFWEQLCTPEYFMDSEGNARFEKGKRSLKEGERYLIIPSYSPENMPKGYESRLTANAAMDLSAARDGLHMLAAVLEAAAPEGWQEEASRCSELAALLPPYFLDETGALREWSMKGYQENNEHRHISHLYCAWPAYETQENEGLARACRIALENRRRENRGVDDTASHGWIHRALVEARLKHGEEVLEILRHVASSGIFFSSLMTHHNTDRSRDVYCTDTLYGIVGIVNEALVYSNTGRIEFLPALPQAWSRGSIRGLLARTRAGIVSLEWSLSERTAKAVVRSQTEQSIRVSCGADPKAVLSADGKTLPNGAELPFAAGEEKELRFSW